MSWFDHWGNEQTFVSAVERLARAYANKVQLEREKFEWEKKEGES